MDGLDILVILFSIVVILFSIVMFVMIVALLCVIYSGDIAPILQSRHHHHCVAQTTGQVTGYCFHIHMGLFPAVIDYDVDGRTYQVVGPYFADVHYEKKQKSLSDDVYANTNVRPDALPDVLEVNFYSIYGSSRKSSELFRNLYPVGTQLTVFYDPERPQRAYVIRPVRFRKRVIAFRIVYFLYFLVLFFVALFVVTLVMTALYA